MSTVAVKGNVIAADTQITSDIPLKGSKLFVTAKGVVGFVGTYGEALRFVDWYKNQRKKKPEFADGAEFAALILLPHGGVEMWDAALRPWPIDPEDVEKGVAIGTGSEYATGAMRAGLGAVEAVEVACTLDKNSGAPVEYEEV